MAFHSKRTEDDVVLFGCGVLIVSFLIPVAVTISIICVAWHFIAKWW